MATFYRNGRALSNLLKEGTINIIMEEVIMEGDERGQKHGTVIKDLYLVPPRAGCVY